MNRVTGWLSPNVFAITLTGVHIDGTGNNTFTFDNLTVSTQGNNADGFCVLNDSNNITVQNSTFTNIFDDVFSLTNSTNLSGTGNTATNFNGLLLNDGGGNTGTYQLRLSRSRW